MENSRILEDMTNPILFVRLLLDVYSQDGCDPLQSCTVCLYSRVFAVMSKGGPESECRRMIQECLYLGFRSTTKCIRIAKNFLSMERNAKAG